MIRETAMQVREYRESDEEQVVELWTQCGLVMPWNNPAKDIQRKLKVDRDLFIVMEDGGRIIATVMGGYEGHRGWINYLAVSPLNQRGGLGRKLMEEIEDRIRARGCPKINLQVRSDNSEALTFYAALGYGDDKVTGLGKRLLSDD